MALYLLSFWIFTLSPASVQLPNPAPAPPAPMVEFLLEYLSIKYPDETFDRFVYVAAKSQKLYLIDRGRIEAQYPISSAAKGVGSEEGSYQTPPGLHRIAEKVGKGLPEYTVIRQKVSTDEIAAVDTTDTRTGTDLITSRVLHLTGLENRVNRGGNHDSYRRGIFIHGTHEEGRIGRPASKGCIRMTNDGVIDLFEKVEVGTFVVILNN